MIFIQKIFISIIVFSIIICIFFIPIFNNSESFNLNEFNQIINFESTDGFLWPAPGYTRINSYFGKRNAPTSGASTIHKGIDIGAKFNSPIVAPANGKVQIAHGWDGTGYGRFIPIDHGKINGKQITSWYGHLNKSVVTTGQLVYKGQTVIGYVGQTGNASGSHLHFGIQENGVFVNPIRYIGRY